MRPEGHASGGDDTSRPVGHWGDMARVWPQIGPPLRPSEKDLALYADAARTWFGPNGPPRVLLLGVTPELYGLCWPEGTDFVAVDRVQAMIDGVWPGPKEAARRADWLDMDLPEASRDIVLADGALNLVSYPDDQRRLVGALRSILAEGGFCILRLFAPPAEPETPDAVIEELVAGRIVSLNVLKLRLWAALQESAEDGVRLAEVWRAVSEAAGGLEDFARRIGWPVEHMLAINVYNNSPAKYHLPTVDEVERLFCDGGGFRVSGVHIPPYEYGDRCPMIVFERTRAQ